MADWSWIGIVVVILVVIYELERSRKALESIQRMIATELMDRRRVSGG